MKAPSKETYDKSTQGA